MIHENTQIIYISHALIYMINLFFKTYKKPDNFFLYIKMTSNYYQKKEKTFQKKHIKGTQIFLKKKKTKSKNMFVSDIEILLRKKKKRSQCGRE